MPVILNSMLYERTIIMSHDYHVINHNRPFATEDVNFWMPVDTYVGGIEHGMICEFTA